MAKLLLKFNATVIKEIPWDKDALTVGRSPDNDIVIDDPAVSGHHLKLLRQGPAFFVEDLESAGGTFLNGKRVRTSGLSNGDAVGVAEHVLELSCGEPGGAAAGPEAAPRTAWLRILKGGAGGLAEFELKSMSTYIGKSDRVQVPIKGSGLFGSAPEVAASIHRKPEGHVLVAVADGYPVVNGAKVSGSTLLKDGDIIDCGATSMRFELRGGD